MADENGNERDARLARIEKERENFRRDINLLRNAQILQNGAIKELGLHMDEAATQSEIADNAWRERGDTIDRQIEALVSAIGELVRRA
ncbi:MAG: hypothetical protein JO097_05995 [Acidobacteriaceae bacterium]|nr:hypothetical protein [Acidobacteriaceae bacterium]MBV9295696.1 hypothetical protein [Acidobacteriaceae bacterium]MBV9764316.1 hypothetical protein [Acidobacteriaceae bacterium]